MANTIDKNNKQSSNNNKKDITTIHIRPDCKVRHSYRATNRVVDLADYKPNTLFHTPMDYEELDRVISSYPKDQRAGIYTVVNMHWNLICANIHGGK